MVQLLFTLGHDSSEHTAEAQVTAPFQNNQVVSRNVHILASIYRSPCFSRTRQLPPKGIELYIGRARRVPGTLLP